MWKNIDQKTVDGFGEEWSHFSQEQLQTKELQEQFLRYFKIFPWQILPPKPVGFDLGCGSGRWAKKVAPQVGHLYCVDASIKALKVAQKNLSNFSNITFYHASVDEMPLAANSMDFGYSLGVLHHIPDTADALRACVDKLKPGAPFLVYLYYAFDNRPLWFKAIWRCSDWVRRLVYRLPFSIKRCLTDLIAFFIYWPLAFVSKTLGCLGFPIKNIPLSQYRFHSFYTMRTDALDRFGTKLEQRFSLQEIYRMMEKAGLEKITHSSDAPYWCVCGLKKLA